MGHAEGKCVLAWPASGVEVAGSTCYSPSILAASKPVWLVVDNFQEWMVVPCTWISPAHMMAL
eukprot:6345427-Lingulodinium_polyedra.AAC.1